jgi:uncharacterized protein DUF3008
VEITGEKLGVVIVGGGSAVFAIIHACLNRWVDYYLKGAAKEMFRSMSEQELEEFASTKRKRKPEHVSKSRSHS